MIPIGYSRYMAVVYRGRDVEVRLLSEETIDFTTATGEITRTYTSSTVKALIGPEKREKEGHSRNFSFMVSDYPEDPPATTTRLVFQDLEYEIIGYSRSSDGYVFDIYTKRP